MTFRKLAFASFGLALAASAALGRHDGQGSTCRRQPERGRLVEQDRPDFEAQNKGVKVDIQYLENEAFKAKLPTLLQSDEGRPSIFYSWGGGVLRAQVKAGFLQDITAAAAPWADTMCAPAVKAFQVDGKTYGVPFDTGEVVFFYNKKLFEKAGVKAEDIKSWDDFLAAAKKIKAAGITPIIVGGGEKWPMHFYCSYLVIRLGGEAALADATAGKNGGFKNPIFVEAGKACASSRRSSPSSPAISPPPTPRPRACSATARAQCS